MKMLKIRKARNALSEGHAHAKILVWANSGTGKTWLVSGSPKPLIILTEANGAVSIANSNSEADYVSVNNAKEIGQILNMARSGELKGYETLVFDSLTEIQKLIKEDILSGRGGDEMTFKDWGKLAERMITFIRMIRDLPFHIVCTALRSESMNDDGAIINIGPAFEGRKTGNEVMQYFSAVAALHCQHTDEGTTRTLHFTGKDIYMVKPCHPIQGRIINPNMATIIDSIINNKPYPNNDSAEIVNSVNQEPLESSEGGSLETSEKNPKEEDSPKKVTRKRRTRKTKTTTSK